VTQPSVGQPAAGQAGASESGAGQPGAGQSGAGQPATGAAQATRRPGQPGAAASPSGRSARRAGDPWRTLFLGVLGLAIVIGASWALLGSSLLVVRHVKVTGNRQVSAAEVRAAAGIRQGTPLARLNSAAATRGVERIAWVQSAQVKRSWPDGVVISIQERTPSLIVASAGQFDVVDVHGVVVRRLLRRPSGMPLLTAAPAALRGSTAVRAAVLVLREVPGSVRQQVRSVTAVASGAVTLHLRGGITVRWGGTGDGAAKGRELTSLMRTKAHYYDISSPVVAVTGK
jgi:cell division protein FtsQ